jgi:hypothetical protein
LIEAVCVIGLPTFAEFRPKWLPDVFERWQVRSAPSAALRDIHEGGKQLGIDELDGHPANRRPRFTCFGSGSAAAAQRAGSP